VSPQLKADGLIVSGGVQGWLSSGLGFNDHTIISKENLPRLTEGIRKGTVMLQEFLQRKIRETEKWRV